MVSSVNAGIVPALTLGAITSRLSLTANKKGARIDTEARRVVIAGQLASSGIEYFDRRIDAGARSPCFHFEHQLLPGLGREGVVIDVGSLQRAVDDGRDRDLLRLGGKIVRLLR